MKKRKIITVVICLIIITRAHAQYGDINFPHPNSILSAAKTTNLNVSGFLMAGSIPTASGPGTTDFVIDQTDPYGTTVGGGAWTSEYYISNDPSCPSNPPLLSENHGCVGVDIIETNPGNNVKYAIAGAFTGGVFFALLGSNGSVVVTPRFWRTTAGYYAAHRPSIRESSSPGIYYICGDFGGQMYVIKVNASGAISWAWISAATGPFIEARDIIEDQNNGDVVVVGRVDQVSQGLAAEAFFMKLNPSTGGITTFNCYGNTNGDEWFTSIEYANSRTGGSGYIIGGRDHHTSPNNAAYKPWMVKMDPNGNVIWSTLIQHANTATDPLEISDVVERQNTGTGSFEYFGVAHTPVFNANPALAYDGLTVWKLDDSGSNSITPREFYYSLSSSVAFSTFYNPAQIELIGTGSSTPPDGIQVFGTDQVNNNHLLFGAYFNGGNGCNSLTDWTWHQGSGYSISPSLSTSNLSACIYFSITAVPNSVSPYSNCGWNNSANNGSNARGAASGIQKNSENSNGIFVYPNPTNKSFTLLFKNKLNDPVHISLINSLGQVEKKIDISNKNSNEVELDFESLQLSEGLYFVNVNVNADTYTTKVMYKK